MSELLEVKLSQDVAEVGGEPDPGFALGTGASWKEPIPLVGGVWVSLFSQLCLVLAKLLWFQL